MDASQKHSHISALESELSLKPMKQSKMKRTIEAEGIHAR